MAAVRAITVCPYTMCTGHYIALYPGSPLQKNREEPGYEASHYIGAHTSDVLYIYRIYPTILSILPMHYTV